MRVKQMATYPLCLRNPNPRFIEKKVDTCTNVQYIEIHGKVSLGGSLWGRVVCLATASGKVG